MCEAINLVWATMQAGLVVFQDFVVSMLDGIASAFAMIPGASRPKGIDSAITDVQKWAISQSPLQCTLYLPEPEPITDFNLPAPTRCWSQYVRGLDDSDFLSCSRSDTCRRGSYEFGTTGGDLGFANLSSTDLTLCDQCPPVQGAMARFGCQTLVKQCTCGVPIVTRTSCLTHSECWLPETSCSLTPDYSTGRSDGGIECSLCPSQPMCLITDGSTGVGRCVCPTQQFRPTACMDGALSPNGAGLCTVDQGGSLHSTAPGTVTLDWGRLAVAPCAIVSNARYEPPPPPPTRTDAADPCRATGPTATTSGPTGGCPWACSWPTPTS